MIKMLSTLILAFGLSFQLGATPDPKLSLKQQNEDFAIFKKGLEEGHSGMYYFITQARFLQQCDSVQNTFREGLSEGDYYLKLRYLITLLSHGHTRIKLPYRGFVNYKMMVLDSNKLYLPFQFRIAKDQLIVLEDCSNEQLIPRFSVVKSINGVSAGQLIKEMRTYIPADGVNQSFKDYTLYNYFYFHHLFNLFYPDKKGVKIEIEKNQTHFYMELLRPKAIEKNYLAKTQKGISTYGPQLAYQADLTKSVGTLRVGSFYKGLIEGKGQRFEPFLDSCFSDLQQKSIQNLILDVRSNEGGGDNYDRILFNYLGDLNLGKPITYLPGTQFSTLPYAINLSDDVSMFVQNPQEFLNENTLQLKQKYQDMMDPYSPQARSNRFNGNIYLLTDGGSFSATTYLIGFLYKLRQADPQRKILFIGEENGGDIFCGTLCAGQSYTIKLPNSLIEVDMPILCFGELKKDYPKQRLPDYEAFPTHETLKQGKDAAMEFALKQIGRE
jgi:hypothetical protein